MINFYYLTLSSHGAMTSRIARFEVDAYHPRDYVKVASSDDECRNRLIAGDAPTTSFSVGVGIDHEVGPARNKPKPSAASLPFGLVLKQTKPAARRKRKLTTSKGADDEVTFEDEDEDDKPELSTEVFDDEDSFAMPDVCHQNLQEAIRVHEQALVDEAAVNAAQEDQGQPVPSQSASSSSGVGQVQPQPPVQPPARAARVADQDGADNGTFFNRTLGVNNVKIVNRRGVKCLHCNGAFEKEEVRLVVALHKKRPERSLHVGCLTSLSSNLIANSVATLQELLQNAGLSAAERRACTDSLDILDPGRTVGNAN